MRSPVVKQLLSCLALACAIGTASAQTYPNRPIRMVVPFPAGGAGDVLARVIGQKMQENWGQPVVVENRCGAQIPDYVTAGASEYS
jgi:tripartite-type tricarboxylate transporter receptor subunit TctC